MSKILDKKTMNYENILKDITEHDRERFAKYDVNSHCMVCGEELGDRKEWVNLDGDIGWICHQCLEEFIEAER